MRHSHVPDCSHNRPLVPLALNHSYRFGGSHYRSAAIPSVLSRSSGARGLPRFSRQASPIESLTRRTGTRRAPGSMRPFSPRYRPALTRCLTGRLQTHAEGPDGRRSPSFRRTGTPPRKPHRADGRARPQLVSSPPPGSCYCYTPPPRPALGIPGTGCSTIAARLGRTMRAPSGRTTKSGGGPERHTRRPPTLSDRPIPTRSSRAVCSICRTPPD